MSDTRRQLPSVDRLLHLPAVVELLALMPRNVVVAAARETIASARASGETDLAWESEVIDRAQRRAAPSLFPVINATGVVLHTNLGRAPLPPTALAAIQLIAGGYSNLELDVATGTRGSRLDHCASLIAETTGAEAGFVVNNAAGALVLALNAIAPGREVIISRGELIEIGGSFRIPDILEKSGATLREVGTTNRTHLADYERAIGPDTWAILVVHRSNFAMEGFVATAASDEIAHLATTRGVPIIHDVGSGLMIDLADAGLRGEPLVNRVSAMAERYRGGRLVAAPVEPRLQELVARLTAEYADAMDALAIDRACALAFQLVDAANEFIASSEPWNLAKQDAHRERLDEVLLDRLLTKCSERLSLFAAPVTLEKDFELLPDACGIVLDVVFPERPADRRVALTLQGQGFQGSDRSAARDAFGRDGPYGLRPPMV